MSLTIKSKMLISILSAFFIIICISAGFSVLTFKKNSKDNLIKEAVSKANQEANNVKTELDYFMDMSRSLSHILLDFQTIPENLRRQVYMNILRNFLEQTEEILSVWTIWEPNSIDNLDEEHINSPGCTAFGSFAPTFYRTEDLVNLETNTDYLSDDQLFKKDYYYIPKSTGAETILEPYYYSYTGEKKDRLYVTNMITPLIDNNQFLGVIGIDLALSDIKKLINTIQPYKNTQIILLSNNGNIVAKNTEYLDYKFDLVIDDSVYNITDKINTGRAISYFGKDSTNKEYFTSIVPFYVGKSIYPWALILKVPTNILFKKSQKLVSLAIFIAIIGFILLAIIIFFIAENIIRPLKRTNKLLTSLAKGKLDKSDLYSIKSNDEIGAMAVSANTLFNGLSSASEFATEIGKNNLNAEFSLLSKKDVLGKSLLKMQQSLKHADEERIKRKEEEEIQRWLTNGIAKFGAILRNYHDITELSNIVINNLLEYINAVQGSLFMLNTNDTENKIYELTAAIAFDRDKLIEKKFEIGEGLVGRCANEKKTIVLHDTPEDFVEITSGMNQENPRNFLLVPLKINDDVFGVIELVSYNHFKKHQIEFVEKIGENIASTLNNLKINNQTLHLLEQAQQQKEELSAQEEEMRQNMEEMQTTQEEASKRELEIKGTVSAFNNMALITEYSINKKLIFMNDDFLKKTGLSQGQIINKEIDSLNYYKEISKSTDEFWTDLIDGKSMSRNAVIKFKNKNIRVKENFSPVYDEDGEVYKIMNVGFYLNND